jgi:hypothetical protein
MKVDKEGNLFAAGPGGIYVVGPDGAHLGSIETVYPPGMSPGVKTARLYLSPPTRTFTG